MEAAATFYSVQVGVAAMAACCIAQHRIAERSAFLRSYSQAVSRAKGGVDIYWYWGGALSVAQGTCLVIIRMRDRN